MTETDKQYLLSLKPEDLTFSTLVGIFGDTVAEGSKSSAKKSRFETTTQMTLTPSEYFVKQKTDTTVGRFIYNKYIVERCGFQDILGYINVPITDSYNGKIEAQLSNALVNDKITMDDYTKYIDYRDSLGMYLNAVITTSFTPDTVKLPSNIRKKRDELFKQYDKELKNGDIVVAERIEKELVKDAKEQLKGDPGLDLYNSEARGNFGNYKNMNIFKGATKNNRGEFEIVRSSFMDGIRKEDVSVFGTSVIAGSYPKSVGK